jgi:hypothetical protein
LTTTDVDADAIMSDLRQRVRDRLRGELLQQGASRAFEEPGLFAEVDALLRRAADVGDADALILPEVLGDPSSWQLQTAIHYQSHRRPGQASVIIFVKRRILMPMFRWLFEYSRDNFERQRRVNQVLFACVQELAAETARLRQQLQQQASSPPAPSPPDRART